MQPLSGNNMGQHVSNQIKKYLFFLFASKHCSNTFNRLVKILQNLRVKFLINRKLQLTEIIALKVTHLKSSFSFVPEHP